MVYCGKNVQNLILSNFRIVYNVKISIFQAVAKEKHWLLGTLITIPIQRIAHDEMSLDLHLYARMSGKGRPGRPWTPLMSGTMLCRAQNSVFIKKIKKKNKEKIGKIKETKEVVN